MPLRPELSPVALTNITAVSTHLLSRANLRMTSQNVIVLCASVYGMNEEL
jgi:hypothetical protein